MNKEVIATLTPEQLRVLGPFVRRRIVADMAIANISQQLQNAQTQKELAQEAIDGFLSLITGRPAAGLMFNADTGEVCVRIDNAK